MILLVFCHILVFSLALHLDRARTMATFRAQHWTKTGTAVTLLANLILWSGVSAESEITECNAFEECQKNIITNSYINCYGYGSCQGSIDTSNNDVGYIDCPSDNACSGSTLTADGHIYCQGSSSCKYTTAIAHGQIQCGGYDSCYQSPSHVAMGLDSTELSVACDGYRSCKYANVKANQNTTCDGYSACHEATITSGI